VKAKKIIKVVCHKIPGITPGETVSVDCDAEGTPLDKQWRRYFKEQPRSKCFEIVVEKPTAKPPVKKD